MKYSDLPLTGTTVQEAIAKEDNFAQAGELYRSFSESDREHLIANLAGDLSQVKNRALQLKIVSFFYRADPDYGTRLAKALNVTTAEVVSAAQASDLFDAARRDDVTGARELLASGANVSERDA
ncbi:MAG: hypothetical protein M3Z23_12045, partial [Acidobacteriota bacterium]|nr:hypothetical protein [Acidobacteriota bacterium]